MLERQAFSHSKFVRKSIIHSGSSGLGPLAVVSQGQAFDEGHGEQTDSMLVSVFVQKVFSVPQSDEIVHVGLGMLIDESVVGTALLVVKFVVGVRLSNPRKLTRPLVAELGRSTARYFVLAFVISGWAMIIPCQFFFRFASKSSI